MPEIEVHPLVSNRWADFERLFGPRGACAGCWCMFWKLPRRQFEAGQGENNRLAQQAAVFAGEVPGLLAYVEGEPSGWIAVEPRSRYPGLARSRILAPLDDLPVWSVPCFFIARRFRRQGLMVRLLQASEEYVARQGGRVVEGYPIESGGGAASPAFLYTGVASAFRQAGFTEAGRRSPKRPIMRCQLP